MDVFERRNWSILFFSPPCLCVPLLRSSMSWFIKQSLSSLRNNYSYWRAPPTRRYTMAWFVAHTHTHCACSLVLKKDRMSLSNTVGEKNNTNNQSQGRELVRVEERGREAFREPCSLHRQLQRLSQKKRDLLSTGSSQRTAHSQTYLRGLEKKLYSVSHHCPHSYLLHTVLHCPQTLTHQQTHHQASLIVPVPPSIELEVQQNQKVS